MFFDFFAKKNITRIGQFNADRSLAKQLRILNKFGILKGKTLEVGPGHGGFAHQCRAAGLEYFGIERSPVLASRLIEEGFDISIGSAPPLPYANDEFDLVCVLAVLEHMATYEQAFALLNECNRVLSAHGNLVLFVPDYRRAGIDFYNWDYSHAFVTTPYRVHTILRDSGFEDREIVHFTGSFSGIFGRIIDVVGFVIHSRFIYWLLDSIGMGSFLLKYHKTFEPAFLVISSKIRSHPGGTISG